MSTRRQPYAWPKRDPLDRVGPLPLQPGKFVHGSLDAEVTVIPLVAAAGTTPGPVLYILAVQHGNELNGADVMRRLIQTINPEEISGTLILIPIANPLAARIHLQSYPYLDAPDSRGINDLNRRWCRKPTGNNHADTIVAALKPIVELGDAFIDLHCHQYIHPAISWTNLKHPPSEALAMGMGLELICSGEVAKEGTFGHYCRDILDKPMVLIEMPPPRFVDHRYSEFGLRGVLNAMKYMGMLQGKPERAAEIIIYEADDQNIQSVTAADEGFLARYCMAGDRVTAGQLVAEIWDAREFRPVQRIESPGDGCILRLGWQKPSSWGATLSDFVHSGDVVADFLVPARIVKTLEG